jgi:hypothetical protein
VLLCATLPKGWKKAKLPQFKPASSDNLAKMPTHTLSNSPLIYKFLNLGDLAVFLETSLPFFVLPNVKYEDYPALANLYKTMKHIPEFEEIDQKFGEFIKRIHDLQNSSNNSPTIFTTMGEIWTTIKLGCYLKWNGIDMGKNLK